MKKALKITGIILGILVIGIIGFLVYFNSTHPNVAPAKDIHVEITPERLERGKYLANYVTNCIDCHSQRDFTKFSGPIIPGTEGMGGESFDATKADVPGVLYAKNITPAGIGDWTDGELFRAITVGVNKKGEALFPLMPYMHFRKMSQEDVYSIIAYIRSLKPIENKVPERKLDFPLNLIVKTIPTDLNGPLPPMPDRANTLAYGEYMTNAVACIACHTKLEKGQMLPGTEFSGGFKFCLDGQCATSANITPDNETGIGLLTKEAFLDKFRFYRDEKAKKIPVGKNGHNTPMPWVLYSNLTDEDLGAIYDYLRTLPPVVNKVEKYSAQTEPKYN
ncbi:MAG: c-type cytochrome [Bacteroidota bacterium]